MRELDNAGWLICEGTRTIWGTRNTEVRASRLAAYLTQRLGITLHIQEDK